MRLLLALLLLTPSITQAQNTTMVFLSQDRPPQIDTLIATVAAIDSTQQKYFAKHGNFAWHPDSLATVGLKLLWNRMENKVMVLPWRVSMIELSRKDSTSKPQTWRVRLVFRNIMCWYQEKNFGPLPRHVDIKSVPGILGFPGLACGLDPRKPAAVTKILNE